MIEATLQPGDIEIGPLQPGNPEAREWRATRPSCFVLRYINGEFVTHLRVFSEEGHSHCCGNYFGQNEKAARDDFDKRVKRGF